jgi:glycosyltransferase involved in cell wall biosynthesis
MEPHGVRTWVSYPLVTGPPRTLEGSPAEAVELPSDLRKPGTMRKLIPFVRSRNVKAIYMADRPAWHPTYALLRLAGVRWIVVHDHTSGERRRLTGIPREIKRVTRGIPGMLADRVIAVSDFVVRRKLAVDLVPPERLIRIWNAVDVPDDPAEDVAEFLQRYGLPRDRPLVMCTARTTPEKGIHHLLRAFDTAMSRLGDVRPRPLLVYMGIGHYMGALETLRTTLEHRDDIRMLGYVPGASRYFGAAAVSVVPSVWQEAFGLAALEPMSHGVPVIASAVGGLPEVVIDGETGLLIPPGDEQALARALEALLRDPERRAEMGGRGKQRAREHFDLEDEIEAVSRIVGQGFV